MLSHTNTTKENQFSQYSQLVDMKPDVDYIEFVCYRIEDIPMDAWHVRLDHVSRRFDRSALYFCGFPTLQRIKHKVCVCVCIYSIFVLGGWVTFKGSKPPTRGLMGFLSDSLCLFIADYCEVA